MPGTITHLIIQQMLPSYLMEFDKSTKFSALLEEDPRSTYTAFGSMGPDFLFFSMNEYGEAIENLVGFIFGVYDSLEPLINFYEENIEPVKQKIDDAISSLDKILFDGLITQIGDTADLISTAALTAAEAILVKNIDLFYPFKPYIQRGKEEKEWYWVDYLHYRRTGQFCSEMWRQSSQNEDLQRYCIGYTSHIASDVVGHSFVNAIVGGPYRTHWHRHKLVENWIDAYARQYYPDDKKTIKRLALGGKDKYVPDAISGSYYYRLCEFPDGELPKELSEVFLSALEAVYSDSDTRPSQFDPDRKWLEETYRLWLMWLKRSTEIGSALPPTPVPPPGAATLALINDYLKGFPPFPGSHGSSGNFSLKNFFKAIFAFVKWTIDCINYTGDWIISHTDYIFLLPIKEANAFVKWLLYQIQLGIWNIYDHLRFSLVMGGYTFPEPRDLSKYPEGKMYINTSYVNLGTGITKTADFDHYPQKQENHDRFGPMEHHMYYPYTIEEQKFAEPAPKPFYGFNPEIFISTDFPPDPVLLEKFINCTEPYGTGDEYTHYVDSKTWNTPQLGSALSFSAQLITRYMDKLPDFNLDADRGYGWKTWSAKIDEFENINNEEYLKD